MDLSLSVAVAFLKFGGLGIKPFIGKMVFVLILRILVLTLPRKLPFLRFQHHHRPHFPANYSELATGLEDKIKVLAQAIRATGFIDYLVTVVLETDSMKTTSLAYV